ncbi:hypothetical protein OF364_02535 [Mycoplasma enhydrae]|uniref:hypothetical protein n=1 Tax=Mycoplasma enhydrae TaxID=2499220 RepID=UPI00197C0671|nr:hypothetical protein [Mycoplasma enhydrae]MBN4089667.1 hypothetical protein [Mycoplasma enhydrae]MCV3733932.1 hypothetical protein [Mycoplasma enhydrae]MCV3753688.1 hypothetical protein [Mycoplasma enhydrae]
MNNLLEKEFSAFIDRILEMRYEDPLKAIYLLDDAQKQFPMTQMQKEIETVRNNITFQIKKNNLKTKTSLETLELINSLKNKKMDYIFMLIYNELKTRDISKYLSEFQYFFNGEGFDNSGFQTLIYDLLQTKGIDYDYKIKNEIINPLKDGSFLKNPDIAKMESRIINAFSSDIAKTKIARQVFSAYLFQNWVEILKNKTNDDYKIIENVTAVLFNEKSEKDLNKAESILYALFK